ncbi:MAG: TetR/AcrR family transcriptional regulator, partial [Bacteroidota bacterium]
MANKLTERQIEIIEAAGKILTKVGISGLTTKNLAKEMQFSESALYRHFENKESIILGLLQYLAWHMEQRLSNLADEAALPEEKFIRIFNNQFDFFKQNPHFVVAVFSDGLLEESEKINQAIS